MNREEHKEFIRSQFTVADLYEEIGELAEPEASKLETAMAERDDVIIGGVMNEILDQRADRLAEEQMIIQADCEADRLSDNRARKDAVDNL